MSKWLFSLAWFLFLFSSCAHQSFITDSFVESDFSSYALCDHTLSLYVDGEPFVNEFKRAYAKTYEDDRAFKNDVRQRLIKAVKENLHCAMYQKATRSDVAVLPIETIDSAWIDFKSPNTSTYALLVDNLIISNLVEPTQVGVSNSGSLVEYCKVSFYVSIWDIKEETTMMRFKVEGSADVPLFVFQKTALNRAIQSAVDKTLEYLGTGNTSTSTFDF